jgi:hypothetical protein
MALMDRYRREDMLANLARVTNAHTGARGVHTWVCDCGCDIAMWFQRTDKGLAFTQQSWPHGEKPLVITLETREEVQAFVVETIANMLMKNDPADTRIDARLKAFREAVWGAWAES